MEKIPVIQAFLDWLKEFMKDKGGILITGTVLGYGIGYTYYLSEKRVKEYVEQENVKLKQEIVLCEEGRENDKKQFLTNMRDIWQFSEQMKNGFKAEETHTRQEVDDKKKTINSLKGR